MFNRRGASEHGLTSSLPAPRRVAWWVWSGLGSVALIGLLLWAGDDHRAWDDEAWDWAWGWVQSLAGWVAQIFGGLGRVFDQAGGLSLGQRLGFFAFVLLLLYFYWRATRAWLAYKPGPVDVQQLTDSTPILGGNSPSIEDLTAEFRRQLSESSMYAPTTLPAEAPPMSFLELLGDIEIDPKKLGVILPRLLSRLRPKLAYRVGGVLRFRDDGPDQYGMTVTVMAFVFGGSRAMTVWGNDWDEVIHKAACRVISSLLPVTRAGRQPPWRQWWGRELDPALYEAYQQATELSRAGRYHEALVRYYEAIRLDPVNPYLRAELAEVQEKMGLHIDALDTCQRALTLDGQTASRYHERLWLNGRRLRYLWHPRLYRDVLGLRYRNSIILGISETTAEQWYERSGTNSDRTHEKLISTLVDRYWPVAVDLADIDPLPDDRARSGNDERAARKWLDEALSRKRPDGEDSGATEEDVNRIRVAFQRASTQETRRLVADDLWARTAGLYAPDRVWSWVRLFWPFSYVQSARGPLQPVTRGAFRVNQKVWGPLRLAWPNENFDVKRSPKHLRSPSGFRPRFTVWNRIQIEELRRQIDRARRRFPLCPLWRRRDWLTLYNSACVYAVAMKIAVHLKTELAECEGDTQEKQEAAEHLKTDLAKCAVDTLEKAVLVSKGKFASVEQAWLVHEDPDLKSLQHDDHFHTFVQTAYPSAEVYDKSAPSSSEQMRDYDYRLLEETAKVMQEVWRRRSNEADVDIHEATEWLRVERDIWERIHDVAGSDHTGKWRHRVELIRHVQANSQRTVCATAGFPPSVLVDEDAPNGRPGSQQINDLLEKLEKDLEKDTEEGWAPHSSSQHWQQTLSQASAADSLPSLRAAAVRDLSYGYAAAWQTLRDWLAGDPKDQDGEKPFLDAVEMVPEPVRQPTTGPRGRKQIRLSSSEVTSPRRPR
ncbi:tetratricopeptide repeat protein [Streptomyces sp.]|uniref:tetratricopeptide repeat protein n=1 Tax=Streptomyces sp. TaxID=1931 RepID=UPI002D77C8E5|nr:tetratricopeptide repeat protein [Streptomyces sp.]HET6358168.1 tetratricopeptide repeat protein [Streptomyces sp.]